MSNSHNSENSAARQASADAENLAPAEAENLASAKAENPAPECSAESAELDVPREEIPGVGGATPTVLQTDVTVDIPLEATCDLRLQRTRRECEGRLSDGEVRLVREKPRR